jgi:hypothetical protein
LEYLPGYLLLAAPSTAQLMAVLLMLLNSPAQVHPLPLPSAAH